MAELRLSEVNTRSSENFQKNRLSSSPMLECLLVTNPFIKFEFSICGLTGTYCFVLDCEILIYANKIYKSFAEFVAKIVLLEN